MKKLVDYTPEQLQYIVRERNEYKWISIIAVITIFGLSFWISELIYQRDSAKQEALNYKAIAEKQTEYYQTKLDTMVFYNDCGVRIELKENE
jgi:hypothetical protein